MSHSVNQIHKCYRAHSLIQSFQAVFCLAFFSALFHLIHTFGSTFNWARELHNRIKELYLRESTWCTLRYFLSPTFVYFVTRVSYVLFALSRTLLSYKDSINSCY